MQVGRRFRRKRFARVVGIVQEILRSKPNVEILDVGGVPEYWDLLPADLGSRCRIHVLNVDAPPIVEERRENGAAIVAVQGDGCDLSGFADRSFDLCHSNSVVEHVQSVERMRAFAQEQRRVGKAVYVQTPYLWFPVEPHYGALFLHWLPAMYRAKIEAERGLGVTRRRDGSRRNYWFAHEVVNRCILLDRTCFVALFPDCDVFPERVGPLVKSLVGIRRYQA